MPKPISLLKPELPPGELWLVRICLLVALGISGFLAWTSLQGGGIPGCGPDSACDKVLTSRWAYIAGLPISIFALPFYLSMLVLVRPQKLNWKILIPLAFLVIASALWFVGLQTFALRAFCKFCMIAHTAGVIAGLVLLRRTTLPFGSLLTSVGFAGAAATALALAQILGPDRTPKQIVTAVPVNPAPIAPIPLAAPTFTIIDGQFTLDLAKVPVAGPLNAPKKVAKLFDYTCHHCRDLHHLLSEFRQKHSNELAVVSLPLPLDSNCNPAIKRTPPAHVNACEYATLGLAVFQANPSKFEDFTDWIYAPEHPPEIAKAREYAANLVGRPNLDRALQDPAVAAQIKTDVNIYLAAYRLSKSGQMPQMYFTQGASIGAVKDRAQLEKIMADNLGFPVTPK